MLAINHPAPLFSAQLRDAKPAEAELLCKAERVVASHHEGLLVSLPEELCAAAFATRISNASQGTGKYLVAEAQGEIVGHASLTPMGLKQIAHIFRLDMCIHQGHWRKGYGRELLAELLAWATTNPSAHKIELLVRSSNIAAIHLYRKAGFIEEGRHVDRVKLVNGGFVDDIAMGLVLRKNTIN